MWADFSAVKIDKKGELIPAKTPVLVKNMMTTDEETTFLLTILDVDRPEISLTPSRVR